MLDLTATAKVAGITGLTLGLAALGIPARLEVPTDRGLFHKPGSELHFNYRGVPWSLTAELDGKPVEVKREWGRCSLVLPSQMSEGQHILQLHLGGISPEHATRELIVDSTAPKLRVKTPAKDVALPVESMAWTGFSEPGSKLQLFVGGDEKTSTTCNGNGRYTMNSDLAPGWNDYQVVSVDAAGNKSSRQGKVFSDRESPRLSFERLDPDGNSTPLRGKDCPKDSFKVRLLAQDDAGIKALRYQLDGDKWQTLAFKANGTGAQVAFPLRGLAEGTRRLKLEAVDRAGRKHLEEAEFLVDSSEKLGDKAVTLGARGEDIQQLQKRLVDAGALPKEAMTGFFDQQTEMAVRQFQESEDLPVTGRVGQMTLAALGPRILVNLDRFELVLDRPGEKLVRFPIACGQPEWPTPTGKFQVYEKVENPAWIPPDSPWAKEAKTIPPGPDNPLGTRWIGLSWGGIGIHGTNAAWTIGSASSHGCIRMHLSDIETLYEMVPTGAQVTIFRGYESDKMLSRYWPARTASSY